MPEHNASSSRRKVRSEDKRSGRSSKSSHKKSESSGGQDRAVVPYEPPGGVVPYEQGARVESRQHGREDRGNDDFDYEYSTGDSPNLIKMETDGRGVYFNDKLQVVVWDWRYPKSWQKAWLHAARRCSRGTTGWRLYSTKALELERKERREGRYPPREVKILTGFYAPRYTGPGEVSLGHVELPEQEIKWAATKGQKVQQVWELSEDLKWERAQEPPPIDRATSRIAQHQDWVPDHRETFCKSWESEKVHTLTGQGWRPLIGPGPSPERQHAQRRERLRTHTRQSQHEPLPHGGYTIYQEHSPGPGHESPQAYRPPQMSSGQATYVQQQQQRRHRAAQDYALREAARAEVNPERYAYEYDRLYAYANAWYAKEGQPQYHSGHAHR